MRAVTTILNLVLMLVWLVLIWHQRRETKEVVRMRIELAQALAQLQEAWRIRSVTYVPSPSAPWTTFDFVAGKVTTLPEEPRP